MSARKCPSCVKRGEGDGRYLTGFLQVFDGGLMFVRGCQHCGYFQAQKVELPEKDVNQMDLPGIQHFNGA